MKTIFSSAIDHFKFYDWTIYTMNAVLMFSGQGTQHPGMMEDLFETYGQANEVFDKASALLGRNIYSITMNSTQEKLDRTENTQPCLLACELAALRVLQSLEIPYEAVLGFSLGEWAALVASGAATEETVLGLIGKRAEAMQNAVPAGAGGMAVILGKDADFVSDLCQKIGGIAPSNYNCPGNITVAGAAASVDRLLEMAAEQGIMASRVAVSIPSHCALMEPAVRELRPLVEAAALRDPQVDLAMNATGRPALDAVEIKENLIRQLSHPVLFQQSIEYLLGEGCDTFVEIGPGKTLSGMVKRTAKQAGKKVQTFQFNSLESVEKVRSSLLQ